MEDVITHKIEELFVENPSGSEITMCYVTSEMMYKALKPKTEEIHFYDTNNFYDFMMTHPILNVELTLTSKKMFDKNEKNKLIKQFNIDRVGYANSVFKYAKLRIFMHAFNIFKFDNKYIWAQSWFNVQTYGIRKKFTAKNEYGEYIEQLISAINNFSYNPEKLYIICFYGKKIDDNTKKILNMIETMKIKYDISLKCNY